MSIVTVSDLRLPFIGRLTRLKDLLGGLLQQGLQPQRLALALALGATIGLLPTVWGTSLLCILCAAPLRLNQLVVQLANYLVYPLQIFLFLPYLEVWEQLFSSQVLPHNLERLWQQLQSAPLATLQSYWQANLQAIFVWLLSSPLLLASAYLLALLLVERLRPEDDTADA
jgi:uncharacterized protein (DUF2062 family)